MKNLLRAASVLAISAIAYPVTAAEYSFLQDDWSDGGVFSGTFVAEDLNNDGQISSFDEEVMSFTGVYNNAQFGSVFFDSLDAGPFDGELIGDGDSLASTGLVFSLDGTGQLGDDFFGQVEGLGIYGRSSGSDFGNDLYLAVGPGPFNLCDGETVCGGLFDAFDIAVPVLAAATLVEGPGIENFSTTTVEVETPVIEDPISFLPEERALATNTNAITVDGDITDPNGVFENAPVLPSEVNDQGGFVFNLNDIDILPGEIFFIDPEIATGYTYEITGGQFASVQAPSLAAVNDGDGQYTLTFEEAGVTVIETLDAGEIFSFGALGVDSFTITGIDPLLQLDPTDTAAFVTGVSVLSLNQDIVITQTPITEEINAVPLPAGGVLLLTGLAGLAMMRRRKTAHDA